MPQSHRFVIQGLAADVPFDKRGLPFFDVVCKVGARLIILLKGHSQSLLLLNIKRGEAEEVALTIGGKGQSLDCKNDWKERTLTALCFMRSNFE